MFDLKCILRYILSLLYHLSVSDLQKMESFLKQNEYKYLIGDADTYGNTCLHYAATNKNQNFAQVLIKNYKGKIKKIINKKNYFGDTPLDVAYSKKSSNVVTLRMATLWHVRSRSHTTNLFKTTCTIRNTHTCIHVLHTAHHHTGLLWFYRKPCPQQ